MDLRVDRKSFRSTVYMVRERERQEGRRERERGREGKDTLLNCFFSSVKNVPLK